MQQDILIIGVLFPAIPLMMINFGNRYTVLANLIRNLHDAVIRDGTSIVDAARFLKQIASLRHRLRLIGFIQTMSALGFMLALSAMIASYLDNMVLSSWLFFSSILLMMVAMIVFMREIQLGNTALDVHLSDLEDHQEWQHLLHPPKQKRRSRKTKATAES
ncbi:DUF2721 domain-containing protein [Alphaproteobacteria bacterium]|jgi:hypothetical protein|nr:DUF2721 domain-containing protein [Alphaproteobacteria bacterium]